jgi:hypothetical protein
MRAADGEVAERDAQRQFAQAQLERRAERALVVAVDDDERRADRPAHVIAGSERRERRRGEVAHERRLSTRGFIRQGSVVLVTTEVQGIRESYEVTFGDVEALRAYVTELAGPDEADAAERLLGQLAMLGQQQNGHGPDENMRFTPVPAAAGLANRVMEALRTEGQVRMGSRRWRLQRARLSRASNRRFAPGRSPGEGAS